MLQAFYFIYFVMIHLMGLCVKPMLPLFSSRKWYVRVQVHYSFVGDNLLRFR